MVLSLAETEILKNAINGTHNLTAYGYEVAIKGTVVDGVVGLVSVILATILSIFIFRRTAAWIKSNNGHDISKESGYLWSGVLIIFIFLVGFCVSDIVLHSILMNIFAPEYVVINKVIEGAVNVVK